VPAEGADNFTGGDFQLTTEAVDDLCYDGAMSTVFMPEGTPSDFSANTWLPADEDLPDTYSISLQEPFTDMEVTVEAGEATGQMVIRGAQQTGILINEDSWADCIGDLSIDVDITVVDDDTLDGTATLTTENLAGDTCPVIESDPCEIVLTLTGTRVE
jgi:hypothetical protein